MTPLYRTLALVASLLIGGCGGGAADAGESATRGAVYQTVREVMYRIEAERLSIEPGLRNPEHQGALLESGRRITELVEDAAFIAYPKESTFHHDEALFEEYHDELRVAAKAFVDAVAAGDLEGWNGAYDAMRITCTRCHKRFDPNP